MATAGKRSRTSAPIATRKPKRQARLAENGGPAPLKKPATATLAASPASRLLRASLCKTDPSSRTVSPESAADPDLPPGVVLLRGFLNVSAQTELVLAIQALNETVPMELPSFMMYGKRCFYNAYLTGAGKRWDADKRAYSRLSVTGAPVLPVPAKLQSLHAKVVSHGRVVASGMPVLPSCDIAVANYYPPGWGSMGGHQDKAESAASIAEGYPVISCSLGDSCEFFFDVPASLTSPAATAVSSSVKPKPNHAASAGSTTSDTDYVPSSSGSGAAASTSCDDELRGQGNACRRYIAGECSKLSIRLDSGDVLLFGGPARLMRHGVSKLHRGMRPKDLQMAPGRLNLQLRIH